MFLAMLSVGEKRAFARLARMLIEADGITVESEKRAVAILEAEMGLAADCRAEQLGVEIMLELCEKIRATLDGGQDNPQPQDRQS